MTDKLHNDIDCFWTKNVLHCISIFSGIASRRLHLQDLFLEIHEHMI